MSVQGKWRVVETPDYDMAVPGAYILFGKRGGEFAFDCLTGSIHCLARVTLSSLPAKVTTKWTGQWTWLG